MTGCATALSQQCAYVVAHVGGHIFKGVSLCGCVRACVRACMRACMYAWIRVCLRARVGACQMPSGDLSFVAITCRSLRL